MNALKALAIAAVVCLLGQGVHAEQQVLHGVECERDPSDNRILLTSPFTAEMSSRIEYPFEILIFRPGRFDGEWDHGTCDVRLTLRDKAAHPPMTARGQASADAKERICRDPATLNAVRQGIAGRFLDDNILRLDFSDAHFDYPSRMGRETPYGYLLSCTATLGGKPVYYGTKAFNGRNVVLWKIPSLPPERSVSGAIWQ